MTTLTAVIAALAIWPLTVAGSGDAPGATSVTAASGLQGWWLQVGYGHLLRVDSSGLKSWQLTRTTCVESSTGYDDTLRSAYGPSTRWSTVGATLLIEAVDGNVYRFGRIDGLPERCTSRRQADDPRYNFDVFWQTFEDHYAFFEDRDLDWTAVGARYRSQIDDATGDDSLFRVFTEMVGPLRDPHITIEGGGREYEHAAYPHADLDAELWKLVRRKYLAGDYQVRREWIQYGWLDETTGYLRVRSMAAFSLYEHAGLDRELELVRGAMSDAIAALRGARGIVVDLRFNGGGWDAVARTIAGYFTDSRRLAYRKSVRVGDPNQRAGPQSFHIEPQGNEQYTGPLHVLMNGATVSAAEVFLLCLRTLPQATFYGESSAGAYSDMLVRELPNGWTFTLSNEVYSGHDGRRFEGAGQPPDVEVVQIPEMLADDRRDRALERANQLR